MKLFIVHVGYYDNEIGIYELHSNMFVAANDIASAKEKIKTSPIFIAKKMHIDGIQELSQIDGYDICLIKQENTRLNQTYSYDEVKKI